MLNNNKKKQKGKKKEKGKGAMPYFKHCMEQEAQSSRETNIL